LFVDIQNNEHTQKIVYDFLVEKGEMTPLDQRLWLEENLSIGYGKDLSNGISQTFSLKFEPCEVEKALEIPSSELNLETNNIYSDIMEETPSKIVCFPYAQHFISDSPGYWSNLKDEKELVVAIKKIDFSKIKTFSVGNFQQMIIFGNVLSFVIITILLFLLFQTM
jgi:hypothetical protein